MNFFASWSIRWSLYSTSPARSVAAPGPRASSGSDCATSWMDSDGYIPIICGAGMMDKGKSMDGVEDGWDEDERC